MSRKEIIKKINSDIVVDTNTKQVNNTLSDSHMKDYQNNQVKNLYKNEMDIILEGFNNI